MWNGANAHFSFMKKECCGDNRRGAVVQYDVTFT